PGLATSWVAHMRAKSGLAAATACAGCSYGLAGFTGASLACGLAVTAGQLIAFRLLQGAGAALMVPQVLNMIQTNFEGASRARALSLYAAVISGGAVVGQVLGGVLVSADLYGTAWRPVFLVNVPIGL